MRVTITVDVENCFQCPFHEEHRILTPDSFEHEFGIYCSEVDDDTDCWKRRTYDGEVNKRLIANGEFLRERDAAVPDWCPHRAVD